MASQTRTILDRIVSLLQNISGSEDGYTYDLTDRTDRVMMGDPGLSPDFAPRIFLADCTTRTTDDHSLGAYNRALTVELEGYAPASEDTSGERFLAAYDLADDICQALEADRTLNSNVINMRISVGAMDGQALGLQGMGYCAVVIELDVIAFSGVGL
jgi:hypothetical protein